MKSLDPRVNRLPELKGNNTTPENSVLDQLSTFEVFVQPKPGKPFQHEGCVHASDVEMAYVLAKETFTRRFTCISLYVTDTKNILVSPYSEGDQNAYDMTFSLSTNSEITESFEIYHLLKRGKQHIHVGNVSSSECKVFETAKQFSDPDKIVYNIWCIKTSDIRFTRDDEKDFWDTLPEKKFRDAIDYKGGDKLKVFLENSSIKPPAK